MIEWVVISAEEARSILSRIRWESYTHYVPNEMCFGTEYTDIETGIPVIQTRVYEYEDECVHYINGELL